MQGDHNIRFVRGHHDPDQFATDIANIARVTTLISIYFHWI